MALIYTTSSIAVTVGTSLTVTHGLGVIPTYTIITIKSNSTTAQVYIASNTSTSQIILLQAGGGITGAIANVDVAVIAAHSIVQ